MDNCPVLAQLHKESNNNPSQSLNELCSKARLIQVFDFTVLEGNLFQCIAQIYDSEDIDTRVLKAIAVGVAKNKRSAKSNATYLLLQDPNLVELLKIRIRDKGKTDGRLKSKSLEKNETEWHNHPVVQDENDQPPVEEEILVVEEISVPATILDDLKFACLKMNHEMPIFEESFMGPPHERIYNAVCKVGLELIKDGHGYSKKYAKRVAANKMFQRITKGDNNNKVIVQSDESKQNSAAAADHHHYSPVTLKSVIANFQSRTGDKLNLLNDDERKTMFEGEYSLMSVLQDIAEEQKLSLDWMEFEESSQQEDKRAVHCLLSVSAEPKVTLMLFWGHGENETTAKENAAGSCLQFMQVATLK